MHENIVSRSALDEPYPFALLNHFTVPCSLSTFPYSFCFEIVLFRPYNQCAKKQKSHEVNDSVASCRRPYLVTRTGQPNQVLLP